MRALVVEELGEFYAGTHVREVPTPTAGPGQVLVRVRAASVNFPDLLMTRGEYQFKPPLPFTPGLDLSGEIAALGEGVTGWKVGDAVVGGAKTGGLNWYSPFVISRSGKLTLAARTRTSTWPGPAVGVGTSRTWVPA